MQASPALRKSCRIYLILVPFVTFVIGFAFGHSPYTLYLPLWMIHSVIMAVAAWILGVRLIRSEDAEKRHLAVVGTLMILPWMLISVFAGMGPSPHTRAEWVATATEQQIRYVILIFAGVLITTGFVMLREYLRTRGETFYASIGFALILMFAPLFVLNMSYWGAFLTQVFKGFVAAGVTTKPDWYVALDNLFFIVACTELGLIYLATAVFAAALKAAGLFRKTACNAYILLSLTGFLFNFIPPSAPVPFSIIGYLVSIPAISFLMPYLMGLNLLGKVERG